MRAGESFAEIPLFVSVMNVDPFLNIEAMGKVEAVEGWSRGWLDRFFVRFRGER